MIDTLLLAVTSATLAFTISGVLANFWYYRRRLAGERGLTCGVYSIKP